jgi:DNA polymerase-3 subunit delta'
VCAARSGRDWLRGLRRDLAAADDATGARAVLDEVMELRQRHLAVLDELARGGPGIVVPTAKALVAVAKRRREQLAERHTEELAALEEAYGVEGSRGWPPGIKARVEKRFERIARAEEQRTLGLLLDDLAGYLRDLVAVAAGADEDALINADARSSLARDVMLLHRDDLLAALGAVSECRRALGRNGAPELHLERLLLSIATSLYVRSAA